MTWDIPQHRPNRLTAWLAAVPDWLFLSAGLSIVVASLILPPWLANRKLAWQLEVMQQQAAHLAQQESSFGELLGALESHDPVMLERLAYEYLRLKPVGATVLTASDNSSAGTGSAERFGASGPLMQPVDHRIESLEPLAPMAIEAWVAKPMPHAAAYEPIRSKLVTTTTGPKRTILLVAGLLLIVIALLPTTNSAASASMHAINARDDDVDDDYDRDDTDGDDDGGIW